MTTRKKYSKEFKLDAVSLVTDQAYTRIEAARSLGICAQMLGRWVKEHQTGDGQAPKCVGHFFNSQAAILTEPLGSAPLISPNSGYHLSN